MGPTSQANYDPVLCELLTLIKLLKPGGVKVVMAESISTKYQLGQLPGYLKHLRQTNRAAYADALEEKYALAMRNIIKEGKAPGRTA